jgi:small subunit ribosomal protein S16
MSIKLRFARGGSKKNPFYRLVATDTRSPRDGKFLEKVGTYDPMLDSKDENRFTFKLDRVEYWLSKGATPSEKVAVLLFNKDVPIPTKYLPFSYPKSKKELEELRTTRDQKKADELQAKLDAAKKLEDEAAAATKAADDEAAAATKAAEAEAKAASDAEAANAPEPVVEETPSETPAEAEKPAEKTGE